MTSNRSRLVPSFAEATIILAVLLLGLLFTWYVYNNVKNQNQRNALQIGKSVVAAIPENQIALLTASPKDTLSQAYLELKASFQDIIKENNNARFAYLYIERNGKYYFLLDSEPSGSPDYSPPGQEFTEVSETDKKPFSDNKSLVTKPLTDRWGTWVSILVPVKDNATGKIIAVFGMDISAKAWRRAELITIAESLILVIALILLGLLSLRYIAKNKHLEKEISERTSAEKALSESEHRYRLLYENASIGIYQTTPDGKILLSNLALLKILGYNSFEELKERNIDEGEFDPNYSREEFKNAMEKEGEIHGLESIWKRQDGELIYIRENAKAIRDENGKIQYYDGTIEDITDRKQAEKALQYSEERFRQIAEQSRDVVWEIDTNGMFTYINTLSNSVLGYSPEELIGKKYFYDLHPEESREDYRKASFGTFQRKENLHEFIHETITGSGKRIWTTTNGAPILDENGILKGYRGADNDITERIERESLLRKLTLAVEQSPVSIVITSIDGAIEYGNPKACETTGYTLEELAGQNPRILKSGFKPSSSYNELWQTIISGKIWHGEFLNRRKNGDLYWEAATISPIFDNEGNIINFLAVKEDITNIKKLISELQEAKDKAESGDLLKTAFIKSISHEIRTPLNGIVGMSEQILNTSLSLQTKEQLLVLIKESSARLINTVNSYLDISMIVSGNVVVQNKPFDLNQLLSTINHEIQPACLSKSLALQLLIPAEPENFSVNTDADILTKILTHLLNNAIKFTNSGNIDFGYEIRNDVIEFFVKDTGIGIDKGYLPFIFEAFTQADVSDSREYEGSGLGLSIAYRLVHLLSGEIRVESEKNNGASFFITFLRSDFSVETTDNK